MTPRQKAQKVLALLALRYPEPETHLQACSPWELMIATILAAQCTDKRVNEVTPELFRRWPGPAELAEAPLEEVEAVVRPTGFYRNKARHIIGAGQVVRDVFGGVVPRTMAELIQVPGVARKTANVVLWGGFGLNEGLAVDTHVRRISRRLGLTSHTEPVDIEQDLMKLFPQAEWGNVNHRLVWFGRHVCDARRPLCESCEMASFCPSSGKAGSADEEPAVRPAARRKR